MPLSLRHRTLPWLLLAGVAASACGDTTTAATSAQPPTPGNPGGATTAAPATATATPPSETAGPRADAPAATPSGAASAAPAGPIEVGPDGLPKDFEGKQACTMKKLSSCSLYGAKYERLDAISKFCGALGGELTPSCDKTGVVGTCLTPANVLTYYYSTGDKAYTKESAVAKCSEKGWIPLP